MLYEGDGVPVDKEKAAQYFKKSADKGNFIAMFNYANMLDKGDGIPADLKKAAEYYKKASDKGMPAAMFSYGDIKVMEFQLTREKLLNISKRRLMKDMKLL